MYAWGQMVSRHYVVLSYQAPYKISQLLFHMYCTCYRLYVLTFTFANTDMISLHEPIG